MTFKGIDWTVQLPVAIEMGKSGRSLQEIGDHFGISRQRVKQVFLKYHIDPQEIGVKLKTRRKRDEKAKTYFNKWGEISQDLYDEKRRKFLNKRNNAKNRGIPFTLQFGDLDWPTHCPILGIELDYLALTRQENSVSFDRRDPAVGYHKGNVFVISWRANRLKNDGSGEEHQLISNYLK